ncbi:MAG: M23 family metallopeptidase [Actinobacteria bacterium]|nr:M23 family metallopeptidase [Actinomycetota bacterium]
MHLVVATLLVAIAVPTTLNNDDAASLRKKRAEWVYSFPVGGPDPYYPRDHLYYPAADITNCRRQVRAPISGVVFDVRRVDNWDKNVDDPGTRGGLTITLHGDDFVRYYFSHLGRLMVKKGQRVESGQKIGTVGDSGNAKVTLCHLHFGISRICPMSEQNLLRGEIWPQRYLDAWQKGKAAAAQRRGGDG